MTPLAHNTRTTAPQSAGLSCGLLSSYSLNLMSLYKVLFCLLNLSLRTPALNEPDLVCIAIYSNELDIIEVLLVDCRVLRPGAHGKVWPGLTTVCKAFILRYHKGKVIWTNIRKCM